MTPVSLDLPTDHTERVRWIEQQLVGLHLSEFAEELAAVQGDSAPQDAYTGSPPSLEEICHDRLHEILRAGLGVLSAEQLGVLLSHPHGLIDLQEAIFSRGGEYWESIDRSPEHYASADRIVARVVQALATEGQPAAPLQCVNPAPASQRARVRLSGRFGQHSNLRRAWVWAVPAGLATASLAAFLIWHGSDRSAAQWGFNRPEVLSARGDATDYLNTLADVAEDWFRERPIETEPLIERLRQFSAGCTALIESPLTPLSIEDRQWLIDRCGRWRTSIDELSAQLAAGQSTPQAVLDAADTIVRKLQTALRQRALTAV